MIEQILNLFGYIRQAEAEADKKKALDEAHKADLTNQSYAAVIAFSEACPRVGFKVVSANDDKDIQIERAKLLAKEVLEISDSEEQEMFSRQLVSCIETYSIDVNSHAS